MARPRAKPPRWEGQLLPGQRPHMGRREIELSRSMDEATDKVVAENHYDVYLSVSRPSTTVEKFSGTLFVERDPHQVRSFAETGAYFEQDHEHRCLNVGLNNPVWRPEHTIDSFETDSVHKLCLCCYDALNYFCKYREARKKFDARNGKKKALFSWPNTVVHHANLFSLQCHARVDHCHICVDLCDRIDDRWDLGPSEWEDYRLEMAFPQREHSEKHETDTLFFVVVRSDQKKIAVWNWTPLLRLYLWPEGKYRHHFEAFPDADGVRFKEDESGSSQEERSHTLPSPKQVATLWLERCMANTDGKHVPCRRVNHGYLPKRLLDVRHALATSRLQIVCPQDDPSRFDDSTKYATLSHCWGIWGAAENPSLTVANLEIRKKEGLSCGSLPKTFSDAIKVAAWLKIPYLWIDSLCILQDSRLDWLHEASVMHHTYQFGTINISASFGTDSRSGLFADRSPESLTLQRFKAPKIGLSWYVTSDNMFMWSATSPAFWRAWIHRERQIAPRILHFTSDGMVAWECCGTNGASFASEVLPGGAPFQRLWNGDTKYQTPYLISEAKKGIEATYAVWHDMCEKFSTKRLTVQNDMPIILSSLAEEFQNLLPDDEYLAGMWRKSLPHALSWRTKSYWPEGDTSKIAPTWSWLSAPAPTGIKFRAWDKGDREIAIARLNDVEIVRAEGHENNIFGPVSSGTLRFEGFMRKIWFHFLKDGGFELHVVDTSIDGDEDDDSKSKLRPVGKSWDEYYGKVCEAEFDFEMEADWTWYECWCMFTTIEEWMGGNFDDQHRMITAIILERLGEADDQRWSRIGTMRMKDLISLKMRYQYNLIPASDTEDNGQTESSTDGASACDNVNHGKPQDVTDHHGTKDGDSDDHTFKEGFDQDSLASHEHPTPLIVQESAQEHDHTTKTQDTGHISSHTSSSENDSKIGATDNPDADTTPDQTSESPSHKRNHTRNDPYKEFWEHFCRFIKKCRHQVEDVKEAERDKNRRVRRKQKKAEKRQRKREMKQRKAESLAKATLFMEDEQSGHESLNGKEVQNDTHNQGSTHGSNGNELAPTTQDDTPELIVQEITDDTHSSADSVSNNNVKDAHPSPFPESSPLTLDTTDTPHQDLADLPYAHSSLPSSPIPSAPTGPEISTDEPTDTTQKTEKQKKKDAEWAEILDSSTEPPVYGIKDKVLSPEEALYQFDGALTRMKKFGYLDWARRLNVKIIEII